MQTLKDEIERVKAEKAAVDALITELQQQVATATQRVGANQLSHFGNGY
jgi:uncharacterized small protein (DUF1192 family)